MEPVSACPAPLSIATGAKRAPDVVSEMSELEDLAGRIQETPGSLLGSSSCKLKQGRLLFPATNTSPPSSKKLSAQAESYKGATTSVHSQAPSSPEKMDTMSSDTTNMGMEENPLSVSLEEEMESHRDKTESKDILKLGGVATTVNSTENSGGGTCKSDASPPKTKLSKAERESQRAEKERARAEAKVKKEAERLRKEQEKREKQERRGQEERERREKREREEQEKREKKEKREAERKKKEEEKKKKEEDKKKTELEKEQAKEEKLRKEQMAKDRFLGFFSRLPRENKDAPPMPEYTIFAPFSVKPGMKLAKAPRPPIGDASEFDTALQSQGCVSTYLTENRHRMAHNRADKEKRSDAIVVSDEEEEDVMIVSRKTSHGKPKKFKLLQFHRNYRPAYYGTWRKRSKLISPKKPFRKDEGLLDYEVDSDEEWEEEEPGESLSNSEGEQGEDEAMDDSDDDGFFVPHGYLSEDEGEHSDMEVGPGGDNEGCKKQKQLAKAKAWEAEFARKCQPLRPVKIGCVWCCGGGGEGRLSREEEFLRQFAALALVDLPISVQTIAGERTPAENQGGESLKRPVPEEAMPELISLVHGNAIGLHRLIKTFRMHWGAKVMESTEGSLSQSSANPATLPQTPKTPHSATDYETASGISKRQLERKIQTIATKEIRPPTHKPLWYVCSSVLQQYGMEPSKMTPLVPLVSPFSKPQPSKVAAPETPCTTKKGVKRKVEGTPSVKSLFEALTKSSSPSVAEPPKEKKPRLEEGVASDSKCKQIAEEATLGSEGKHTEVVLSLSGEPAKSSPPETNSQTSDSTPSPQENTVIVIDSDNLLEGASSAKENMASEPVISTSSYKALHSLELHANALQECTNGRQSTPANSKGGGPMIDWQKLLASANEVVVTADIH